MTNIFITSLAGGGNIGSCEQQLGNVAILIPMIKLLKQYIPDVEITTNIQLSEAFHNQYGINSTPKRKRYLPRFNWALELVLYTFDIARAGIWRFFKDTMNINAKYILKGKRLNRFIGTDIVLDFNGDIFPSDTSPFRALSQALEIITAHSLGIPVIEFVSSPGPFNTWFRRTVAKLMYKRIDIFLNREDISSGLLKQLGIKKPILTTACPSFLLEPASPQRVKEILSNEGVDIKSRPLIGITLSGYNLTRRIWGKRESFTGLELFVPTLKWLLEDLGANVILLPHVYRINPYVNEYELINGPDHDILLNLIRMVGGNKYQGNLKLIEGKYSASEAKAIIGQFDIFLTGRLHAGVAALSQGVPTVLIAYGHKHQGFARLLGQEKYAYQRRDPEELKALVTEAWTNKEEIARVLRREMARVKELVYLNFQVVKEIATLDENQRNHIPEEMLERWAKRGAKV